MHRHICDGIDPLATLIARLADDDPTGAQETGDDARESPDRAGAEDDHGPRQGDRAQPKCVDARRQGLRQNCDIGRQLVVDDVDAARRHRDELPNPPGRLPPTSSRC